MSQLLDQHNKLIDNLKRRDDIIQKKFNALDDRLGLSSFVEIREVSVDLMAMTTYCLL